MSERYKFVESFQKSLFERFKNGYQSWWPNFIFHYSDVQNIASILNSGKLYSREKACKLGLMANDNADSEVIGKTQNEYLSFVRCYFGAKTPTQYRNEGILPEHEVKNGAHCPVPVFLLFDFVKLLAVDGVRFSGGNIAASDADIFESIEDLEKLEFGYIYDRGSLPNDSNRNHILYCRHAEVLIPDELNVYDYLRYICVRSEAEREMLLYRLEPYIKKRISKIIKVFTKDGIFYNNRLLVNSVTIGENANEIIMRFSYADRFEFDMRVIGEDRRTGRKYDKSKLWKVTHTVRFELQEPIGQEGFYIRIEMNGDMVYENIIVPKTEGVF